MTTPSPVEALSKKRGWLIAGGILSLIVGVMAISSPYLFSIVITQLLGAFLLVNGVIGLFVTITGSHLTHRVINALSAVVRIVAGAALLFMPLSGALTITLILAIVFVLEGVFCVGGALGMRQHPGWFVLLLNGIVAVILGLMVLAKWPSDAAWVLGLLYGIQSLFGGISLLTLALSVPKSQS
jgi:uncharacterized membrane protein HdeD (DUF308 family)